MRSFTLIPNKRLEEIEYSINEIDRIVYNSDMDAKTETEYPPLNQKGSDNGNGVSDAVIHSITCIALDTQAIGDLTYALGIASSVTFVPSFNGKKQRIVIHYNKGYDILDNGSVEVHLTEEQKQKLTKQLMKGVYGLFTDPDINDPEDDEDDNAD